MSLSRSATAWRPALQHPDLAPLQRRWLATPGSLTARIQAHSQRFALRLLQQHRQAPTLDERACLHMNGRQQARVREVLLMADEQACIFAHSVLSPSPSRGRWQLFARTGCRPLGAALFTDPRIRRQPLHYRRLDARHPLYRAAVQALGTATADNKLPSRLWARRSLFTRGRQSMLVCEVFLPAVYRP